MASHISNLSLFWSWSVYDRSPPNSRNSLKIPHIVHTQNTNHSKPTKGPKYKSAASNGISVSTGAKFPRNTYTTVYPFFCSSLCKFNMQLIWLPVPPRKRKKKLICINWLLKLHKTKGMPITYTSSHSWFGDKITQIPISSNSPIKLFSFKNTRPPVSSVLL